MTTTNLLTQYNLLAKRLEIPTLKSYKGPKAKLQAKVDELASRVKGLKKEAKQDDGKVSVATLARELGINPKVARAKLRRKGLEAGGVRWSKLTPGSDDYKRIRGILEGTGE